MTNEELAAIKARWNWILLDALPTGSQAKADVRALLAEVEAWRAIGRTLIELDDTGLRYYPQTIDDLIVKASALLAGDGGDAEVTP